jgi:hypothetical protein
MASNIAQALLVTCLVSLASTVTSGCGDDGGGDVTAGNPSTGDNTTAPSSTGTADDGPDPTTQGDDAEGTATLSGDSTTMTPGDSSGSGSEGSGSESGSDDASGTATDTGDGSSSSSGDGGVVPGCEVCEDDEVCVVNQGLANEFDCQPTPKACDADVDCDCGASLCVEPFVGCFDPSESSTLFCACIAC